MSIGSLLSMQPTWLTGQYVSLGDSGKFRPRLVADPGGLANTETISWPNSQCSVDMGAGMIAVAPEPVKPYGFLPWQPGGVTFLEIGAGAQLVLTGPLSACTVWAFESGGTTVLVHANANGPTAWGQMTQGQKDANMTTKLNAVNAIKARYGGAVDVARLVYAATPGAAGAQTYEGYQGFVLGCKPRLGFTLNKVKAAASKGFNTWTFYFFGFNGPGNPTVLWPL